MHVHKHTVSLTMYSTTPFYILIATDILATSENILDDQHVIISTKITRHITHGSWREILWHLKPLEVHMLRGTRWERDDSSTMDIIVINYTLCLPVGPYIKKWCSQLPFRVLWPCTSYVNSRSLICWTVVLFILCKAFWQNLKNFDFDSSNKNNKVNDLAWTLWEEGGNTWKWNGNRMK